MRMFVAAGLMFLFFFSLVVSVTASDIHPIVSADAGRGLSPYPLQVSSAPATCPGNPSEIFEATPSGGPGSYTFTQPKAVDLDNDGQKEVVSVLLCSFNYNQPKLYVWNSDGSIRSGFPKTLTNIDTSFSCDDSSIPSVANIIGSGTSNKEIIVPMGSGTDQPSYLGGISVFSSTGSVLQTVLSNVGFSGGNSQHAVVADINNDGTPDVYAASAGYNFSDHTDRLMYLFNPKTQSMFDGWPREVDSSYSLYTNKDSVIVDLDGDGQKEIVVLARPTYAQQIPRLKVFNSDGSLKNSVEVIDGLGGYPSKIIVGDVDGDAYPDIVVSTFYSLGFNGQYFGHILVYDRSLNLQHSWSVSATNYGVYFSLGDLNKDGKLDIITNDGSYRVAVYNYDGTLFPGYPRLLWDGSPYDDGSLKLCGTGDNPALYCGVTTFGVGDLDCDGYPDIFATAINNFRTGQVGDHFNAVFAFDRNGNTVSGFPYPLVTTQSFPPFAFTTLFFDPPTLSDLDGDGYSEILADKGFGRLSVVKTNRLYTPSTNYYPTAKANNQNNDIVPTL